MDDLAHLQMLRAVMLDELVGRVTPDILVQLQVRSSTCGYGGLGSLLKHFDREQFMMSGEPDQVVVAGDHP